jgi:Maltose operon periplasmic protein precursor (MalM)
MPAPKRSLATLTLAILLADCGSRGPAPIVSLADRACASQPSLLGTPTLLLGDSNKMDVAVDAGAPCVQAPDGSRSAYVAVALPATSAPYVLSVRSAILGQTVFAPRMELLDGEGRVHRDIPRSAFMFHGASLYAAVRSHPDERFLVVFSDPGTVGQSKSQVHEEVNQQTFMSVTPTAAVSMNVNTGNDHTIAFTYADNGKLTIAARPLPAAE